MINQDKNMANSILGAAAPQNALASRVINNPERWYRYSQAILRGYGVHTGIVNQNERNLGLVDLRSYLGEINLSMPSCELFVFMTNPIECCYDTHNWEALALLFEAIPFNELSSFVITKAVNYCDVEGLEKTIDLLLLRKIPRNDIVHILRKVIEKAEIAKACALLASGRYSYEEVRDIYQTIRITDQMADALHEPGKALAKRSWTRPHYLLVGIVGAFCLSIVALCILSFYYHMTKRVPSRSPSFSIIRGFAELNSLVQGSLLFVALISYKITKRVVPLWPPPSLE